MSELVFGSVGGGGHGGPTCTCIWEDGYSYNLHAHTAQVLKLCKKALNLTTGSAYVVCHFILNVLPTGIVL